MLTCSITMTDFTPFAQNQAQPFRPQIGGSIGGTSGGCNSKGFRRKSKTCSSYSSPGVHVPPVTRTFWGTGQSELESSAP